MKAVLRNILAVVLGAVIGSAVNMGLIYLGYALIPPPDGVDPMSTESMRESMHLYGPKDFLFPFLAHAIGTLAGALVAYLAALSHRTVVAYVVAALSFAGGIFAATIIPAPAWFVVLDLVVAYAPMGWLATNIGATLKGD